MAFPALLLLLFGIASLVAGIRLLKRGRWPARVGDEPYCRACEYLLLGIDSQRCPECGAPLGEGNIIHGTRERRTGLTVAGAGLILLGILLFLPMGMAGWKSIEWIRLEPTSWLIRDVKGTFAWPAWRELERRSTNRSLSDTQIQAIVDIALQQQMAPTRFPFADEFVAFAGDQLWAGKMTPAQKQRFCVQSILLSAQVPAKIAMDRPVQYLVNEHSGCPSEPWWVTDSIRAVKIDGKNVVDSSIDPDACSTQSGLGAGGAQASSVTYPFSLGRHQLDVVVHINLYRGIIGDPANSTEIYQEDRDLPATFEGIAAPTK